MNLISILKISYNFLVDYLGPFLDKASPVGMVVLFQEMGIGRRLRKPFLFQRMCVNLCFVERRRGGLEDPEVLPRAIAGLL